VNAPLFPKEKIFYGFIIYKIKVLQDNLLRCFIGLAHRHALGENFFGPLGIMDFGQTLMRFSDQTEAKGTESELTNCSVIENLNP
jgi:hypothetical protein